MPIIWYYNKMTFAIKKGSIWLIGKIELNNTEPKMIRFNKKTIQKDLEKVYGKIDDFKLLEEEKTRRW